MGAERLDRHARERDVAPRIGRLDLRENEAPVGLLHIHPDVRNRPLQIDILPSQAQQLPLTHARREGEHIEGLEAIALRRREQTIALFLRQDCHFCALPAGRADLFRDVALDESELHRVLERAVQHPMQVVDG